MDQGIEVDDWSSIQNDNTVLFIICFIICFSLKQTICVAFPFFVPVATF